MRLIFTAMIILAIARAGMAENLAVQVTDQNGNDAVRIVTEEVKLSDGYTVTLAHVFYCYDNVSAMTCTPIGQSTGYNLNKIIAHMQNDDSGKNGAVLGGIAGFFASAVPTWFSKFLIKNLPKKRGVAYTAVYAAHVALFAAAGSLWEKHTKAVRLEEIQNIVDAKESGETLHIKLKSETIGLYQIGLIDTFEEFQKSSYERHLEQKAAGNSSKKPSIPPVNIPATAFQPNK